MDNYYTLLHISDQATDEEIAAAYRRERERYSPEGLADLDGDFRRIVEQRTADLDAAYAVLSDPQRRRAYDADARGAPAKAKARPGVSRRELLMVLGGALVGLLVIGVVWVLSGRSAAPESPAVGELRRPAPDIQMPSLAGGPVRLTDYRGKVVLVNFWGTWCEPCKDETPALQKAYSQLRDQGLVVVGVNLRKQEPDMDAVRAFVQRYGVTYPVALDVDGALAREFQISPIPVSYFIDRSGTVRYVYIGPLTAADVEALFQRLQQDASVPG